MFKQWIYLYIVKNVWPISRNETWGIYFVIIIPVFTEIWFESVIKSSNYMLSLVLGKCDTFLCRNKKFDMCHMSFACWHVARKFKSLILIWAFIMEYLLTRFDKDTITYFTYVDKMIHNLLNRNDTFYHLWFRSFTYHNNLYLNMWIFESHIPETENHIYHTQVQHSNPCII